MKPRVDYRTIIGVEGPLVIMDNVKFPTFGALLSASYSIACLTLIEPWEWLFLRNFLRVARFIVSIARERIGVLFQEHGLASHE